MGVAMIDLRLRLPMSMIRDIRGRRIPGGVSGAMRRALASWDRAGRPLVNPASRVPTPADDSESMRLTDQPDWADTIPHAQLLVILADALGEPHQPAPFDSETLREMEYARRVGAVVIQC